MSDSTNENSMDISSSLKRKYWDISNYIYWSLISFTLGLFVVELFLAKDIYLDTLLYKAGILLVGFLGYGLFRRKVAIPNLMILVMTTLFLGYCFYMVYETSGYLITFYFILATLTVGGINYLVVWKSGFSISLVLISILLFLGISALNDWNSFFDLFPQGGYVFFFVLILTSFIPDARQKNYALGLERDAKKDEILRSQAIKLRELEVKYAETLEIRKIENQKEKILRHDLKNKVNNITGLTQIIADAEDQAEYQTYLQLLKDVSTDLLKFSDNVFTRGDSRKYELNISLGEVDLQSAISKIQKEFLPKLEEKGQEIIWKGPKERQSIWADTLIFNNILTNLFNYLILWSKPGANIEISTVPTQTQLRILIAAPSAEISADELNHIFKPLDSFQFTSSFSAPQGMGLQIAKSMTEQMGGYFKYQTEINKGVIFKLEFHQTAQNQPS